MGLAEYALHTFRFVTSIATRARRFIVMVVPFKVASTSSSDSAAEGCDSNAATTIT